MASHRRLLWLAVVLAGLGAALLFATGTANASTGSTSADGSSNPTSSDSSTTTSTPDDSEASSENPGDTTTPAASTISVAIRPSSLLSAITRARDARLSTTQPQSSLTTSRRVPYTTPSDVPLRPPSASDIDIDPRRRRCLRPPVERANDPANHRERRHPRRQRRCSQSRRCSRLLSHRLTPRRNSPSALPSSACCPVSGSHPDPTLLRLRPLS